MRCLNFTHKLYMWHVWANKAGGAWHIQHVHEYTLLTHKSTGGPFNSLSPRICSFNIEFVIFKLISWTDILSVSCEIALSWMPQDITGDKSTLVQVMAWCHQATCHYLSQRWHKSVLPYSVTGSQWANMQWEVSSSDPVKSLSCIIWTRNSPIDLKFDKRLCPSSTC